MTTLDDIAKKAGVSVATASRALNPSPAKGSYVNSKTKDKVLKIAKKLKYSPNFSARNLSLGISNTVGIVFGPNSGIVAGNDFGLEMMFGIQSEISKFNYTASVVSGSDWAEVLENVKLLVKGTKTRKFILLYSIANDPVSSFLKKEDIPFVVTGKNTEESKISYVDNDNFLAGQKASIFLVTKLKENHPLIITSNNHWNFEEDRVNGFKSKLNLFNKQFEYLEISFQTDLAKKTIENFFEKNNKFDSIIATDDRLAFIARTIFRQKNKYILDTISFNFSEFSQIDSENFYSFNVNPRKLGKEAVKIIFSGNKNGSNDFYKSYKLVEVSLPNQN